MKSQYLKIDNLYHGDCRELLTQIKPSSVNLSFWSPPYHVGKEYELEYSYDDWKLLLKQTIELHKTLLMPGAFMVINIGDILCFPDPSMPKIQASNVALKRSPVTREQVMEAQKQFPDYNRKKLGELLNCSEQTIDRRLNGVNIRGGKYNPQTRVKLVGEMLEQLALNCGLYLYDRRIWVKDPTWATNQWHSSSYRSVSEFEDLYFFWKPGETQVNRKRLTKSEWTEWGSRQVWFIRSVKKNQEHPAQFPEELAARVIKLLSEPNQLILDPFLGSGTTAIVAAKLGRHYIGIDKEEKYLALAQTKIEELKLDLFSITH